MVSERTEYKTHQLIFTRKTNLEIQKQVCIGESNRSIESLHDQLQTERSQLNQVLQQYQSQGSWSDALEKLMQELVEAEQQGSDDRKQIAYYLQRLEGLDDQVRKFCAAFLNR
jgi:hypothetical protein